MLRGFVSGGAWALIMAAFGLTTASLLAPQPPGSAPPNPPLVTMAQVEPSQIKAQQPTPQVAVSALDVDPEVPSLSTLEPPVQTAVAEIPAQSVDTSPLDLPVVSDTDASLPAPAATVSEIAAPGPDSPVLPNPQAPAPALPETEDDLILSTETAVAVPRSLPDPDALIAVIPVVPDPVAVPVVIATGDRDDLAEGPGQATAPVPAEALAEASVEDPIATDTIALTPPTQDAPIVDSVVQDAETATPSDPVADPVQPVLLPQTTDANPEQVPAPVADPDGPPPALTLAPDLVTTAPPPARIVVDGANGGLPQVAGGVRINRPETPDPAEPAPALLSEPVVTDGQALAQFAAPFSNPDNKPMMSVILIDDGTIPGLSDTLSDVPFPVSIAIDPAGPDATARMQAYRAKGIEVLAIAALPQGAQPSDVEVTLEFIFATLPQAVGLIDFGDGGVQANAAVTGQTLARLAADGRGLVVMSRGLNPALRAAIAADVPAVEINRDLDGNGQDAGTIRRFLDNAAFQARQESGIVLLARLRPETLSALIMWGTEGRAGQVALSPISGSLTQ